MVSPAQMQDGNGDGEGDESRPQIGTVGFVLSTRSLCVYTPLGWIDVEVGRAPYDHIMFAIHTLKLWEHNAA